MPAALEVPAVMLAGGGQRLEVRGQDRAQLGGLAELGLARRWRRAATGERDDRPLDGVVGFGRGARRLGVAAGI